MISAGEFVVYRNGISGNENDSCRVWNLPYLQQVRVKHELENAGIFGQHCYSLVSIGIVTRD